MAKRLRAGNVRKKADPFTKSYKFVFPSFIEISDALIAELSKDEPEGEG